MKRAAALAAACLAFAAIAAEPSWPPPPQAQARIDELRRTIGDPKASAAQRQAARDELVRLLMNPSRADSPLPPMPPRAAIEPGAVAAPAAAAPVPRPPVTSVAPPERPALAVPDHKGGAVVPAGKAAIDPKTGATLVDVGNGWLDPATGRFVPRN